MISSLLHLVGLRPRVYYTFKGGGRALALPLQYANVFQYMCWDPVDYRFPPELFCHSCYVVCCGARLSFDGHQYMHCNLSLCACLTGTTPSSKSYIRAANMAIISASSTVASPFNRMDICRSCITNAAPTRCQLLEPSL